MCQSVEMAGCGCPVWRTRADQGCQITCKWKVERHAGGVHSSMGLAGVTRTAGVIAFWKSLARLMRKCLR